LPVFDPKKAATIYHSLYSLDLSPTDYFLFPKLKIKLKGLHFSDVIEIQEAVTIELKKVQKEEFLAAFQELFDRARVYIYANGANFEFKNCYVSSSCVFDLKQISPQTFGPHCIHAVSEIQSMQNRTLMTVSNITIISKSNKRHTVSHWHFASS
jgi:hypothetical protein